MTLDTDPLGQHDEQLVTYYMAEVQVAAVRAAQQGDNVERAVQAAVKEALDHFAHPNVGSAAGNRAMFRSRLYLQAAVTHESKPRAKEIFEYAASLVEAD